MAHIPLMEDQDSELGDAPSYDDVENGTSFLFRTEKSIDHEKAVAHAHVSIRMGEFSLLLNMCQYTFYIVINLNFI